MILTKVACPHCDAVIKSPAGVEVGKKIVCPKCREPFVAAALGTAKKTPPPEEDEEERVPARRSSARSTKRIARPREEDQETEEQDEGDERQDGVEISPRKRKGKKRKRQTPPSLLLPALLIGGAILLLAGGGVGFYFLFRKAPAVDVPAGWGEVVSAQGRFRAMMPQPVDERPRRIGSVVGPITDYQYLHEAAGVNPGYSIDYADFSPTQFARASAEQIIDAGRDEMLKQYTGQLEADRRIEQDGRRGREVVIFVPGRGRFLMHYYIADRRLYTVMMVGPKVTLDSKEARAFFDSFRFTDAKR